MVSFLSHLVGSGDGFQPGQLQGVLPRGQHAVTQNAAHRGRPEGPEPGLGSGLVPLTSSLSRGLRAPVPEALTHVLGAGFRPDPETG